MQIILGQQYNVGEKPTVPLYCTRTLTIGVLIINNAAPSRNRGRKKNDVGEVFFGNTQLLVFPVRGKLFL